MSRTSRTVYYRAGLPGFAALRVVEVLIGWRGLAVWKLTAELAADLRAPASDFIARGAGNYSG